MSGSIVYDGYGQLETILSKSPQVKIALILVNSVEDEIVPGAGMKCHMSTQFTLASAPQHWQGRVQVVFKLHPDAESNDVNQDVVAQSDAYASVDLVGQASLADVMRQADIVIFPNVPTSTYLVALFESKPPLCVRTSNTPTVTFALSEWGGGAVIRDLEAIGPILEKTLFTESVGAQIVTANRGFGNR